MTWDYGTKAPLNALSGNGYAESHAEANTGNLPIVGLWIKMVQQHFTVSRLHPTEI
ncbi:MAG: hypothetical protein IPF54_27810 [Draconibacterium sp.]|nr:hypothetical protein [Draconibacterium sp.]